MGERARRSAPDHTSESCSSWLPFHPKRPVFSGSNRAASLSTPLVFERCPVDVVRRLSVVFFINELQLDQCVGNGLWTDFDGQLSSDFLECGVWSFCDNLFEEFVMRLEFWFWSGFWFDGFDISCFSNTSFKFGDEGRGDFPFFGGGGFGHSVVTVVEDTFSHFGRDRFHGRPPCRETTNFRSGTPV